jgi:hypothetical protein
MEIGKPQINIPKVIEEHKLEQASSELQAKSPGFATEDLLEVAPNNDGHASTISAESFGQPQVPHPSLHGPHFELGSELREALKGHEPNEIEQAVGDAFDDLVNGGTETVPLPHRDIKDELAKLNRIVENLKDRIQDSVESTIHPFEDWFD